MFPAFRVRASCPAPAFRAFLPLPFARRGACVYSRGGCCFPLKFQAYSEIPYLNPLPPPLLPMTPFLRRWSFLSAVTPISWDFRCRAVQRHCYSLFPLPCAREVPSLLQSLFARISYRHEFSRCARSEYVQIRTACLPPVRAPPLPAQ